jgi:hypothetical protein
VLEVVRHVVAGERQHRERVAPHHALLAGGGGGGLAAHGGGHVHALDPVRASVTSGTVVLRRPPKMKASIGTPFGLSHSASSTGLWIAATVKRAFGCAAGRGLPLTGFALAISGVQSRPCQSIRCAGAVSVMSSHQTSPSSVSATLVKMQSRLSESMQFGLVWWLVPGATPK